MFCKIIIKCLSIFLFVTGFISSIYANNDVTQDTLNLIFDHAQSSIASIEDKKIFFFPEKVFLYQGKIYVESEQEAIPLPSICSDESGLFLSISKGPYKRWICANFTCAKDYSYEPKSCLRCGGTRFVVRYYTYPGSPGSGDITGAGDRED